MPGLTLNTSENSNNAITNGSSITTATITPTPNDLVFFILTWGNNTLTLTLTQVATSSGGNAVYTGTITGGATNAFAGYSFVVTGFTGGNNNGTFTCTASTTTTLTLNNNAATAETHAAQAVTVSNIGVPPTPTDTQTNTWTQVGSVAYTTGTTLGSFGLAIWYATMRNSTALTVSSGTITHAPSTGYSFVRATTRGFQAQGGLVANVFDTVSTSHSGTGTSLTSNSVVTNFNNDALFLIGTSNSGQQVAASTGYTQLDSGANSIFDQFFPFVGAGYSLGTAVFNVSPYTWTGTLTANADWVTVLLSIQTTNFEGQAQGDTAEASGAKFNPFNELFFNGDIFLGGYTGLLFLKNVFMLPRDYWDKALSTPYSGQLFPNGAGTGGPGQVYPY